MALKVKNVADIMESLAPVKLKDNYDNVGLMVGNKENSVTNILVALDCTLKVVREAVEKECSLILTHHPVLFRKPSTITTESLLGIKIIELIKNNIDVYSSHTNLDKIQGGMNDLIVSILGFDKVQVMEICEDEGSKNSGIGRLVTLEKPITLASICDNVKASLKISSLKYTGEDKKLIEKIAIINGSGTDYFDLAKALKADCIITGDTTYHYVSDLLEEGISIIDPGHFATEWPAMITFSMVLKEKLREAGYNNSVIISEEINDPYKYR
jgi:dinuclear metal center YbgI/SA1388 family protein